MRWTDGPLLGFDTETTGVDVRTDRVVAAALVYADGPSGTRMHRWLLDPGVPIPAGATAVHGITTEHAREHGRPAPAALDEIAALLARALLRGVPIVAFNAAFDLSLLDAELRRHGLATLPERIGGPLLAVLDPLVLDRWVDRYRTGSRRLGDLCREYGVADARPLHEASADVLATLRVLRAMAMRHPRLAERDLGDLHALQVRAHRSWAEGFNAWRAAQGFPGPGADPAWPVAASRVAASRVAAESGAAVG